MKRRWRVWVRDSLTTEPFRPGRPCWTRPGALLAAWAYRHRMRTNHGLLMQTDVRRS